MLGRRAELAAIGNALAGGAQWVTLVGPGGAGKTTLADAYAARAGRVVRVDLASGHAPLIALASALGLRRAPIDAVEVAAALDARGPTLVLMDRAEPVLDALAAVLPVLLDGAPDATWLVTSRVRLGARREHVIPVAGLEARDAIELLHARAPGASSEHGLAAIAAALEGMPLALEITAARLSHETSARVVDTLERRRRLGGVRACPVRGAVDGAIDALDPRAAAALSSLAVFDGRFGHDAAEAVLGATSRELLELLRERALVARAERTQGAHVLHDEVRAICRERAPIGHSLRARQAAWLAREAPRWARDVHEGEPVAALRALSDHAGDLEVALAWAHEHEPASAARIALGLESWLLTRAPEVQHQAVIDTGLVAAERAGDLPIAIELSRVHARALFLRGRLDEARAVCADAMHRARSGGDRRGAQAIAQLASAVARQMGDPGAARALAARGLQESRDEDDGEAELRASHNLASALAIAGELSDARALYLTSLAIARERRARRVEALCLANLAMVHDRLGELDLARARCAQAIAAFAAQDDRMMTAKLAMQGARLAIRAGQLDEAEHAISGAVASAEELGDRGLLLEAHLARAERDVARGEHTSARAEADEALALARHLRAGAMVPEIEQLLASLEPTARDATRRELAISADASSFRVDRGARVDLARRPNLRRILAHLVALHVEDRAPRGAAVSELVSEGWPGEKMTAESGAERVYTAIRTLRRLGLAPVLARRDGGYALDPAVVVVPLDAS